MLHLILALGLVLSAKFGKLNKVLIWVLVIEYPHVHTPWAVKPSSHRIPDDKLAAYAGDDSHLLPVGPLLPEPEEHDEPEKEAERKPSFGAAHFCVWSS